MQQKKTKKKEQINIASSSTAAVARVKFDDLEW